MTHEMQFIRHRENGADEWCCPMCRRQLLIQLQPTYRETVLTEGDATACHVGGSLKMRATVETEPPLSPPVLDFLRSLP